MRRFNLFLIISLSLTAFLAGYLVMKEGVGNTGSKTGTILEKFEDDYPPTTNDQRPTTRKNAPFLISERRIVSPANHPDKAFVRYFEQGTGKLFEADLENRIEQLAADSNFPNFLSFLWSPLKESFIGKRQSEASRFKYINLKTGKNAELDSGIRSVAFSPDGKLIAYYLFEEAADSNVGMGESGQINISEPDGSYSKKIIKTRIKDLEIFWPSTENIALKTPASEIFLLTQDGKLTKILESTNGLEERWSPSGNKLLFSGMFDPDNALADLWIKDLKSKKESPLEIEGKASKCVWGIDDIHIFCALAKSPSVDEIYKINTADRTKKLVAEPYLAIMGLFLSNGEDYLLFINSEDKLHALKISD